MSLLTLAMMSLTRPLNSSPFAVLLIALIREKGEAFGRCPGNQPSSFIGMSTYLSLRCLPPFLLFFELCLCGTWFLVFNEDGNAFLFDLVS